MPQWVRLGLAFAVPAAFAAALVGFMLLHLPALTAAIAAVASGVVLGLLAALVTLRRERSAPSPLPTFADDERLLKQGPAEYYDGGNAVAGFLYLTDRRVLFKPNQPGAQTEELSLRLEHIVQAQAADVVWMYPTGLHISTDARRVERFGVPELEREAWAGAIEAARQQPEAEA